MIVESDAWHNVLARYGFVGSQPLYLRRGSDTRYYVEENPGSITGLFNGSAQVTHTYEYQPFGLRIGSDAPETFHNPLRFAGQYFDQETGLYYMRARYYDPRTYRFISEDPIGLGGGINAYAYAFNDPINLRDATGLNPECIAWRFDTEDQPVCIAYRLKPLTAGAKSQAWLAWAATGSANFGSRGFANGGYGYYHGSDTGSGAGIPGGWGSGGQYHPEVDPNEIFENPVGQLVASAVLLRGAGRGLSFVSTYRLRFALHTAHHNFGKLGRLPHFQINWWRKGVKGSGGALRIPIPPGWYSR